MRRYTIAKYAGPGWTWAGQERGRSRSDALRRLGCKVDPGARIGEKDGCVFTALRAADSPPRVAA